MYYLLALSIGEARPEGAGIRFESVTHTESGRLYTIFGLEAAERPDRLVKLLGDSRVSANEEYYHHKGNLYRVRALVWLPETDEPAILYCRGREYYLRPVYGAGGWLTPTADGGERFRQADSMTIDNARLPYHESDG